jgi:hypothetical protein
MGMTSFRERERKALDLSRALPPVHNPTIEERFSARGIELASLRAEAAALRARVEELQLEIATAPRIEQPQETAQPEPVQQVQEQQRQQFGFQKNQKRRG